jgi:preprotein translocase subunit SecE
MRRLQKKEEERAKKRRQEGPRSRQRERVGIRQYVREIRQELKKVAWPSRQETMTFSIVVLVVTVVLTALIFAMDFGFKQGILRLLDAA